MRIISEFLRNVINENEQELLVWFSDQVYEYLCLPAEDHLLMRLDNLLDLREVEAVCADYHQPAGNGRPVEHSVRQLLRALLVRYLYVLSLRETEAKIRFDMLCKWFVGYDLFAPGPDHTRLQAFEAWLLAEHPRLLFDTVLQQIDAAFPQRRDGLQFGDTFALLANAQQEGKTARIRHASRLVLAALKKENQAAYERVEAALEGEKLWGAVSEKGVYKLPEEERQARRRQAGEGACHLLRLVAQEEAGFKTAEKVALLRCVLEQIFGLLEEAAGPVLAVKGEQKATVAGYPIYSVADPEATLRKHGENKIAFGYNASLLTTTDFVREIEARPGSEHDSLAIVPLLQAQAAQHELLPEKLVYDQAAGTGKVAADVDQATQGQTQLVSQPVDYSQRKDTFGPQDFSLSDDALTATCPAGQSSNCRYRTSKGAGWGYRFYASTCRDCPLWKQCRANPEKTQGRRDVFFSDHQFHQARLVAYSQTESFAQEMPARGNVERIIALLTRYNGARRARFRGRAKVDFQLKMCATAYNLKRWLALERQRKRPPPADRLLTPVAAAVGLAA